MGLSLSLSSNKDEDDFLEKSSFKLVFFDLDSA